MKNIIYFLIVVAGLNCDWIQASLVFMRELEGEKHLVMADDDGGNPRQITHGALWNLYPDIDALGGRVAWVRGDQTASEIVVRSLGDAAEKVVSPTNGLQLHPDFSGDGRTLAFSRPVGGRAQIVIVDLVADLAGEATERILVQPTPCYFPSVSSDGSFLVFQRDVSSERREIVEWDTEKRLEKIIESPGAKSMAPALSPDDRFIAFTVFMENSWQVYVRDRLSGVGRFATSGEGRNFAPTFRPNGNIVFASDREGHFALYEIGLESWQNNPSAGKLLVQMKGDLYAPSVSGQSSWVSTPMPDIPTPARSSFGAIRVGRNLYVIGGHQGPEHTYPEHSFLDRVDIFNLDSQTWRQGSPRLVKSHGFGLAQFGKYIYAFGGFAFASPEQVFTPKWRSLDIVERYDTERDVWETVGKLPRRRSSNAVASLNGKAFLIGGWDATPRFDKDYDGTFHRAIDVFDFKSHTVVESFYALPDPLRRAFSSVTFQGEILLVGGLGQGATHFELLDRVTAFNPETGRFRELPRLPFATFAPAAGILDNTLLVFGGMFKTSPKEYIYVNHVFGLDLRVQSSGAMWAHTGRYLRDSKGFAQVVDVADGLIVMGGHGYFGEVDSPVPTVDKFTGKSLQSWKMWAGENRLK